MRRDFVTGEVDTGTPSGAKGNFAAAAESKWFLGHLSFMTMDGGPK